MKKTILNSFGIKRTKSRAFVLLMLVFIFSGDFLLQAQNNHYVAKDVYIAAEGFIYISTGDTVHLNGNIATARNTAEANRGMIAFNGTSGWVSANGSFVDGYVRSQKPGAFIFPLGQGSYHPAAISKAAANAPTDAAYYNTAFYSTLALDNGLHAITNESWIIQGTTPAKITLSWNTNLSGKATALKELCVVGWDISAKKWVVIASAYEATSSIFGTTSDLNKGTVTTTSEIVPNSYAAYTLGVLICPKPPTVNSHYETCIAGNTLTLADIPTGYTNIQWYKDENLATALQPTEVLKDSTIYWITQNVNGCKSEPSYVKVFLNDNMNVPPATVPSPLEFCSNLSGTLSLANLQVTGENLLWFRDMEGAKPILAGSAIATIDTTYYVAQVVGGCQSATLTPVSIRYVPVITTAPVIASPQYFCKGATIADIVVPRTDLVWYDEEIFIKPLPSSHILENKTYYAKIKSAGNCVNSIFASVLIKIDNFKGLDTLREAVCNGKTLADLPVSGYGIKWYTDVLRQNLVPETTTMIPGITYYAAKTAGDCAQLFYEVFTKPCFTLHGTVFPFVHDIDPVSQKTDELFNNLYKVTARLYAVPKGTTSPILALKKTAPLYETKAVYYDGSVFVATTPLHPGKIGSINNPGGQINWDKLGYTQGEVVDTKVLKGGALPDKPVGLYSFINVEPGWYILTLSAPGFVTYYAKIWVNDNGSLNHRELISGDLNNDGIIDQRDATIGNSLKSIYLEVKYKQLFDVNKDRKVNDLDIELISNFYFGFSTLHYEDSRSWLFGE